MTEYLLNFWLWWYAIKTKQMFLRVVTAITFLLEYSNTLPMARNLTMPLFQDSSGIGKILSIFLRAIWVWVGGSICVVIALPLLALVLIFAALPLVVLFQIASGLVRLIL